MFFFQWVLTATSISRFLSLLSHRSKSSFRIKNCSVHSLHSLAGRTNRISSLHVTHSIRMSKGSSCIEELSPCQWSFLIKLGDQTSQTR